MQYRINSNAPKVIGIIFFDPVDPLSGKKAMKYSYVTNSKYIGVRTFMQFVKKFPTSVYVNFYSRETGLYIGRLPVHR